MSRAEAVTSKTSENLSYIVKERPVFIFTWFGLIICGKSYHRSLIQK